MRCSTSDVITVGLWFVKPIFMDQIALDTAQNVHMEPALPTEVSSAIKVNRHENEMFNNQTIIHVY